jgi:cytochrome c
MKSMRSDPHLRVLTLVLATLAVAPVAAAQTKAASAKAAPAKVVQPPGDVAAGKAMFSMRCAMCHGAEGQGGGMGPRLRGVYGAKAASQPDQKYSPALIGARPQWTAANLDAFLTKPQAFVPGTRMMAMTPKPEARRDLIAYLSTLRK